MALLSKSIEDAFKASKAAAASGGGGNYLNAKDLNDENIVISFVGDEEHVLIRHIVWGTNRIPLKFTSLPTRDEIKERAEEEGAILDGKERSNPLYAFTVWNYNEDRVQVFEFSQKGLANPIMEFLTDEEGKKTPHLFDLKLRLYLRLQPQSKLIHFCFFQQFFWQSHDYLKQNLDFQNNLLGHSIKQFYCFQLCLLFYL